MSSLGPRKGRKEKKKKKKKRRRRRFEYVR